MTFEKGSLVLIDYTAKIKDTEEVFESTIQADAMQHSIHDPSIKYQSKLVSVGESWVLEGLDDALAKTSEGDRLTVEVTPEKGFGQRDSGKVRMIPLRKLGDDAEKVSIGDSVEIDNKRGIIRYIGSGRVQIDFNHKFAGKTILYDVTVIKALKSDDDKISAILKNHIPIDDQALKFQVTDDKLDVFIPTQLFNADGLQTTKNFTQQDLFKFIPTLSSISFIETHENKNKKDTPIIQDTEKSQYAPPKPEQSLYQTKNTETQI